MFYETLLSSVPKKFNNFNLLHLQYIKQKNALIAIQFVSLFLLLKVFLKSMNVEKQWLKSETNNFNKKCFFLIFD